MGAVAHQPFREALAPDLHRLSLPHPAGFVNVYLLSGPDGIRLIDAGCDTEKSWWELNWHLDDLGLRAEEVVEVLLTHTHSDHIGLVPRLAARAEFQVLVSAREVDLSGMTVACFDGDWLIRHGSPPAATESRVRMQLPAGQRSVGDVEEFAFGSLELRVATLSGHSPGLLSLVDRTRGLVFTSDHLMPVTTPLIAFADSPDDLVAQYLAGLDTLSENDPGALVLPGHGRSFRRLHDRIDSVRLEVRERVARFRAAVTDRVSAGEVSDRVGWSFPPGSRYVRNGSSVANALAHLRHLERLGQITQSDGEDGFSFAPASN